MHINFYILILSFKVTSQTKKIRKMAKITNYNLKESQIKLQLTLTNL
jgi:hypothetical protein